MAPPKKLYKPRLRVSVADTVLWCGQRQHLETVLDLHDRHRDLVGGRWRGRPGRGGQVVPGFCLTLPFILLSGYAGQISDKFSKQTVMFWVKVAEVPIALLAAFGFFIGNLWLTLFALLLLSIQSSFFGPAKLWRTAGNR